MPSEEEVLADLKSLLSQAKRPTSRALLEGAIAKQHAAAAASAPLARQLVAPAPAFSLISRYAWDQSKKFVKVYVTIPGVEEVPDERVRFDVANGTSLTLEVLGLPPPAAPPNARLSLRALHSPVLAEQCSWTRKADSMVLVKLRKAVDGDEWGSLDDSAVQQAKKKAKDLEDNKGKSTAELLGQMYANADEEGKASLTAAWEAGRSKREQKT